MTVPAGMCRSETYAPTNAETIAPANQSPSFLNIALSLPIVDAIDVGSVLLNVYLFFDAS